MPSPDPTCYGDSAVVAYRLPVEEIGMADLRPKATANAGAIDAAALPDDDLNSAVAISAPESGGPAWVQYEFAQPFRARAISLAGRAGIPVGGVLASDDGAGCRFCPPGVAARSQNIPMSSFECAIMNVVTYLPLDDPRVM